MMHQENITPTQLFIFSGDNNFDDWKKQIRPFLMAKGYWDLISGDNSEPEPEYPPSTIPPSSNLEKEKEKEGEPIEGPSSSSKPPPKLGAKPTNKKDIKAFRSCKNACMGIILMYLSNPIKDYVENAENPKVLWDLLCQI